MGVVDVRRCVLLFVITDQHISQANHYHYALRVP